MENQISYINLPSFLYGMEGGADLTLVGLLTGFIEPPLSLSALTYKNGSRLGMLELVGVKVHARVNENYEDVMDCLCIGKVPVLVDEFIYNQYKKKKTGKLAITLRGYVTLSRGVKNRGRHKEANLVVGFRRYLSGNVWCAAPFKTSLLSKEKDPFYFNLLMKASKNNWVLHDLNTIKLSKDYTRAGEGVDFVPLDSNIDMVKYTVEKAVYERPVDESILNPTVSKNIGVSTDTNLSEKDISELLKNRNKKEVSIKTRFETVAKSGEIKDFSNAVLKSKKKVSKIIDNILNLPQSDWSEAIEYMAYGLSEIWLSGGKTLFIGTLLKLFPNKEKDILLLEGVLGEELVMKWCNDELIEDFEEFMNVLSGCKEIIYINIIDTVLKLRGKLVESYYDCNRLDISILTLLHRNPYYIGLVDNKLSIEELDLLARLYNIKMDKSMLKLRNAVYTHLYLLNKKNKGVGNNTIIKKGYLYYSLKGGDILNSQMYTLVTTTGKIITEDQIKASKKLFAPTVKDENITLNPNGWVETWLDGVKKYFKTTENSATILDDYLESGLGVLLKQEGVQYISDYVLAEMELYVYEKLYNLSTSKISKIKKDKSKIISEFEYNKSNEFSIDFKLEEMQKNVVELANFKCGCLTGCAGSGKTTCAELLLDSLEKGANINGKDMVFVAPTGRASARLREVVKKKASTIHSYFGIKAESYSIFNDRKTYESIDASVVFGDEMTMCNLSVMYSMLRKIGDNTRLYLIGDKEQLTPIGFGKPFVSALHYLPTVALDVSKRASDDSDINKNAKKLIDVREGYKPLESGEDFAIVPKNIDDIEDCVLDICKYHLGLEDTLKCCTPISKVGKVNVDDIQIVTPVKKGVWGTKNLNKRLQRLLNPRPVASVVNKRGTENEVVFKVGDRVIHTENQSETIRLQRLEGAKYKRLHSDLQNGVMNGDIGKVIDIQYSGDIRFIGDKALKHQYDTGKNTYYLVVEYSDVDSESLDEIKYCVLYRFESPTHTNHMEAKQKGNGLGVLDLAYALTVHKLQGSQARLIVSVLQDVKIKGFISRNILYTGVTRAREGCYLIGDVVGVNSALEKGRRIEQSKYINTPLDKAI